MEELTRFGVKQVILLGIKNSGREPLYKINRQYLSGLSNLTNLKIESSKISEIPEDLFDDVTNLTKLSMNSNQILSITNSLGKLEKLEELALGNNYLTYLADGTFKQNTHLKKISLYKNKLKNLTRNVFLGTEKLEAINLIDNDIQVLNEYVFDLLPNLSEIYLSNNNIKDFPDGLFKTNRKLRKFIVQNNRSPIRSIPEGLFTNLTELTTVAISTGLQTVPHNLFATTRNLKELRLSRNNLSNLDRNLFEFLQNLEVLDLSYNNLKIIPMDIFRSNKRLKIVKMAFNRLTIVENPEAFHFNSPFLPLTNLMDLNLSHNNISNIFFDWNCGLMALKKLDLSYNKIISLNEYSFSFYPDSIMVNLEYNQIREIRFKENSSEVLQSLNSTPTVYLDGNPIDCNCYMAYFMKFLHKLNKGSEKIMNVRLGKLFCNAPPQLEGRRLVSLRSDELFCEYNTYYKIQNKLDMCPPVCQCWVRAGDSELLMNCSNAGLPAVPTLPRLVDTSLKQLILHLENNQIRSLPKITDLSYGQVYKIFASNNSIDTLTEENLPAAIYYKYQQEIKIWMYWHNICTFVFNSDTLDANKKYDAFISYSHKDEDFIADTLVPELEFRRKLNLCIHRRDWTVGDFIPDQIIRSVEESRRTIIVLSPKYVESVWGKMEFRVANQVAVKENISRVIVILYGDIDINNLNEDLKTYIDMNTYIKWGDPWFWERLHYALKTIKTTKTNKKDRLRKVQKTKAQKSRKMEIRNQQNQDPSEDDTIEEFHNHQDSDHSDQIVCLERDEFS
ncbi:hypothetical protein DMENIID0001_041410 [Sergentomyia squamirostris]